MSVYLGTFSSRSVDPASPALLTKDGPLGALILMKIQLSNLHIVRIRSLRMVEGRNYPPLP